MDGQSRTDQRGTREMVMNELKDPEGQWDEIRNRGMCIFIICYAVTIVSVCFLAYRMCT